MKTSNKLLAGTGILILLGIFSFAYILRGAYQKAIANPFANEVRIDLKAMKYLNIEYSSGVTFKYGKKFEIVMNETEKKSTIIDYQGDRLNIAALDISNLTIYSPQLPILSLTKIDNSSDKKIGNIVVDSSFQSGDFVVTSLKNSNLEFRKCRFDKVDIQSKEKAEISMENSEVKLLNLSLPKHSELHLNYSNILAKNIVLGDSCNIIVIGNQSFFLK